MRNIFLLTICSIIIQVFSSCGFARISQMRKDARVESKDFFVLSMNDAGDIDTSSVSVSNNEQENIVARQDARAFYRVSENGQLVRMIKGPINLYYSYDSYSVTNYTGPSTTYSPPGTGYPSYSTPGRFSSSNKVRVQRFFDFGLDTKPQLMNYDNLNEIYQNCSDCKLMLEKYNRVEKQNKIWKYINWGAMASGLTMTFTKKHNKDFTDAQLYTFSTLFFGSLVSGVFRIRAKGRNIFRLEDSIYKYNEFSY